GSRPAAPALTPCVASAPRERAVEVAARHDGDLVPTEGDRARLGDDAGGAFGGLGPAVAAPVAFARAHARHGAAAGGALRVLPLAVGRERDDAQLLQVHDAALPGADPLDL